MTEFRDQFLALRIDQKNLAAGIDDINHKYEPYIQAIKTTVTLTDEELKKQVESTSIIKKLEKQKEKVQNTWKEDTKENITLKNKEIERLDEEIKNIKNLALPSQLPMQRRKLMQQLRKLVLQPKRAKG